MAEVLVSFSQCFLISLSKIWTWESIYTKFLEQQGNIALKKKSSVNPNVALLFEVRVLLPWKRMRKFYPNFDINGRWFLLLWNCFYTYQDQPIEVKSSGKYADVP